MTYNEAVYKVIHIIGFRHNFQFTTPPEKLPTFVRRHAASQVKDLPRKDPTVVPRIGEAVLIDSIVKELVKHSAGFIIAACFVKCCADQDDQTMIR